MSKYVYETCGIDTDGAIECRSYNNGKERQCMSLYRSKLIRDMQDFTVIYARKREISDEEYSEILKDVDLWRIYTVHCHGFDHYYKGSADETDYLVGEISEDRILVSDGKFVGVLFFSEDAKGSSEKLCEGEVNAALITDIAATSYTNVFPGKTEDVSLVFLAYTGFTSGTSYVHDYSYKTYYLGKK